MDALSFLIRWLPICSAVVWGAAQSPAIAATRQPLEQTVKASFLFKFAPFVEWPGGALGAAGRPFTICITAQESFGRALDEVVRGQRINGRSITVRRMTAAGDAIGCHILFVGSNGDPAILTAATGLPVLTVSDTAYVPGSMIKFVMKNGRVRFEIDDALARANGLNISSKLLNLAVAVERK